MRYQAALRPDMISWIDSKVLSNFISTPALDFWPRPCTNRALIRALHHDRAHSFTRRRSHLAGSAVELLQGFALHLQFHLGILLEDLRVSLAKHLRHPLIRYAPSTQPRGIGGAKVVDAEVWNLCAPKSFAPNRLERGLMPTPISIAGEQTDCPVSSAPITSERLRRGWLADAEAQQR